MQSSSLEQQPYKGLANIGATCYMNSLLQTLFMTRQFRNCIYRWRYDQKMDGRLEDSILYQLQKLFARLETKYPLDVDTRDLVKSFQWGGQEILQQQDIQEFNRVLFQALEQSIRLRPTTNLKVQFLTELYEGVMLNYTRCRVCGYQHPRQQTFQDLIITVKNKYARLYNDSVELGLQRYLKPELLDGNNLYFCQQCQCKVEAQRFGKFLKLPKLLGLVLQRFTFDYVTASRQKLNDEVRFPWVLNMNDFMDGYEGIPNKLPEDKAGVEFQEPVPPPQPKPLVIKRSTFLKAGGKTSKLPNNIKNRPTPATKGFLNEMRKKTGKNNEPTIEMVTREKYAPLTEEQLTQQAIEQSLKDMREEQLAPETIQPQLAPTDTVQRQEGSPQGSPTSKEQPVINSAPQLSKVILPIPAYVPSSTPTGPLPPPPPILDQMQEAAKLEQLEQAKRKKQEDIRQLEEFNTSLKEQIEKYLHQGPMVYELYSILIHSGGPHHGHYYAYIRSMEDRKWYCFNDYKVTELNVKDMMATVFGGKGGTNAYGLYYRQVDKQTEETEPIPEYITSQLKEELAQAQQIKQQKIENEDKYMKLKLAYQLYVKTIEVMNTMTLRELLEKAKITFGADCFKDIQPNNLRLRLFNPVNQMKLETFTGREDRTLEQLRIGAHKCLLVESKRDQDQFEQYVAGKQSLRVAVWTRDVCSLDESTLKTTKISVDRMLTMKELEQYVIIVLSLPSNICLIKRHQNDEYSYHEIVNTRDYDNRTLEDVCLLDNEVLFVEPDNGGELQWPKEFEAEVHRVCIRYNLPTKQDVPLFGESIIFDSRAPFGELRNAICEKHKLDSTEVVFKRNSRSGLQLKSLTDTLKEYRFITGTQIYLEEGIPAQPGEVRILLHMSYPTELTSLNSFSTFEQIADIPINGNLKAQDCKQLFLQVLKRLRGIQLQPNRIRLREKLAERMTKIYRQKPMREQQLIEKRAIAIEKIDFDEQLDVKENILYVKIFDPQTWQLGPRFEVTVTRSTTMDELATVLEQRYPELPAANIEICKITSLYKFSMLDLAEVDYYLLKGIDIPVTSEPLFVNNDGLLYIVKDLRKKLRDLTREEEIRLGGTLKTKPTKTSSYKPPTKKESGVKITVKHSSSAASGDHDGKSPDSSTKAELPPQNQSSTPKLDNVAEDQPSDTIQPPN